LENQAKGDTSVSEFLQFIVARGMLARCCRLAARDLESLCGKVLLFEEAVATHGHSTSIIYTADTIRHMVGHDRAIGHMAGYDRADTFGHMVDVIGTSSPHN
jgi:hypothetical protein